MLAVYALRGLIVWPLSLLVAFVADRLTGCHLDTPEPLRRGSWPHTLVEASPAVAVFVAVLLRLPLTLAPAAAAAGPGSRAAVRRSLVADVDAGRSAPRPGPRRNDPNGRP